MCNECRTGTCVAGCPNYTEDNRAYNDKCDECGEPICQDDMQVDIEHGNGIDSHYHLNCLVEKSYTVVIDGGIR